MFLEIFRPYKHVLATLLVIRKIKKTIFLISIQKHVFAAIKKSDNYLSIWHSILNRVLTISLEMVCISIRVKRKIQMGFIIKGILMQI